MIAKTDMSTAPLSSSTYSLESNETQTNKNKRGESSGFSGIRVETLTVLFVQIRADSHLFITSRRS